MNRFARDSDVAWRQVGEEIVVVPISRQRTDLDNVYVLNDVGARIWQLLDGERGPGDIAGVLAEEYEIGRDEAECDVREYLIELRDAGIVTEPGR